MVEIVILWFLFGALSLGILGLHFVFMRRAASKPWRLTIDKSYSPKISFLIPTYNESDAIRFKLENLLKVDYPKDQLQVIVVDSNSTDRTVEVVKVFTQLHPELDVKLISESKREGKSVALNTALNHATGELIVVSDADSFYPNDILQKSVPYLSDPKVGAISGPKFLLNGHSFKVAKDEENYLRLMNLTKLGESKTGFTPLFEGGFSAFKRGVLTSFDPYNTGSDDAGTVLDLAERSYSALLIPEAAFFTIFPVTRKERWTIKIRRANQLVRVFGKYLKLFLEGRIKFARRVILTNILLYLFCPVFFFIFLALTIGTFVLYPYLALLLLLLFIPGIGSSFIEVLQGYFVLLLSVVSVICRKDFLLWKQPADRRLLTEEMLKHHNLI